MFTKICSCCKTEKPLDLFVPDKRRLTGKGALCRECKRKIDKEYSRNKAEIKQHRDKRNEYARQKRENDWVKKEQLGIFRKIDITIVKCSVCGKLKTFKGKRNTETCGLECSRIHVSKKMKEIKGQSSCIDCGKVYIARVNSKYCPECKTKRNKALKKAYLKKRKLQERTAAVENVISSKVFNRDKWTCKFCGIKVQSTNHLIDTAAELDHIVPISLGGPHSYSNVQTLCRKCNRIKSNTYKGQLVLSL